MNRRSFIKASATIGCGLGMSWGYAAESAWRRYHVCLSRHVCERNPELLEVVRDAGVTDIWQAAFFYGHWHDTVDGLRKGRAQVESLGLRWHVINVPLGHPGDSLGDSTGQTPLTPPGHWRMAESFDGTKHSGTSLHPPGTAENVAAVSEIATLNPDILFLDDDFRLAVGPGRIGGCFCDYHRDRFLEATGFPASAWDELRADAQARRLSRVLRAWVEFTCDELTACFRAQQAAAPDVRLGNMIMFFGAEKAGIRLTDYHDAPFRVGELMFNDASFDRLKGKTDELFSVLFHRRYARPEWAWSETTAFPADQLSARNLAAKLATSTIADVRNTMFMSGMTPFPLEHWATLKPAMAKHARVHARLHGHAPKGPFKHYWGEAERYVGEDKPYSLFLASGIPFETVDTLPDDGWTFLSEFDARALDEKALKPGKGGIVTRQPLKKMPEATRTVAEELSALFEFKRRVVEAGYDGPRVEDDKPVVCAWYPTAGAVLLWNLSQEREAFRVRAGAQTIDVDVEGLDVELVEAPDLLAER
jgi:hypothetical protein